ncbi:hypothetical protein RHSIM_RhsimUnG0250400 [Rhododendron simsii]|uniref:RING-type domain-containing protein n=1 Tax=Rhododendron simsii TaxID=118357 RepID=A0A834FTV3_RHOSS|nr:hypothetical protein RHSIM_RhsimUnG0250400 [Rhododendron simsii]
MTDGWFSGILLLCCRVPLLVFSSKMGGIGIGFLHTLMKKAILLFLSCSLVLGGAAVGTIPGAIKGQTTETGLLRGAAIGAVAGAIAAVQLMELMVHGEPFSKVALLFGLLNGKFFMEWMAAVVQKAHQWEISNMEENLGGYYSDIFEMNIGSQGVSQEYSIKKLPESKYSVVNPCQEIKCIICLEVIIATYSPRCLIKNKNDNLRKLILIYRILDQNEDFKDGDITRILPSCGHSFHLQCIDEWLARQASCPTCRKDV